MAHGRELIEFGNFVLDVTDRRLMHHGAGVPLSPKAHDVLLTLARHPGRVVTKDELLEQVWPDTFVNEGILTVHVSAIRKALNDEMRPPRYIETVSKSGYRFVAPVTTVVVDDEAPPKESARPRPVQNLVVSGREILLTGVSFRLPEAVSMFRKAIRLDPSYAAAHAGLALACCAEATLYTVPQLEAYAEAKPSALRALAMDSGSADAQVALGTVLWLCEWDWLAAQRAFQRALAIEPAHIEGLLHYGALLETIGQPEAGLRMKERALEQAPESPLVLVQLAKNSWHRGQTEDAIRWARKALAYEPGQLLASEFLTIIYFTTNDLDSLIAERIRRAHALGLDQSGIAVMQQRCERLREAMTSGGVRGLATYLVENFATGKNSRSAMQRALLFGYLDQMDIAFAHLDEALRQRDPELVYLAISPVWNRLRQDARYHDRVKAMGLS